MKIKPFYSFRNIKTGMDLSHKEFQTPNLNEMKTFTSLRAARKQYKDFFGKKNTDWVICKWTMEYVGVNDVRYKRSK